MKLGHVHIPVSDLDETVRWFESVCEMRPSYRDQSMAELMFGTFPVIFDKRDHSSRATLGFISEDCDRDFQRLVHRGANAIEPPTDRSYGPIRSAYLKGPGELTIEIEQITQRA